MGHGLKVGHGGVIFRHGRNSVRRRAIMVKMMVEEVVIQAVMVG